MRRSFAFVLSLGCSAFAGCVFNDQGAVEVTTASTTGAGGKPATSASVSTVTGPGATTTASSSSGAGGAGGGSTCNDGVIEGSETCEPGSLSFASCVDCSLVHTCGNGTIEPGEACDDTTANCVACEVSGGSCAGAPALPVTGMLSADTTAGATLMIPGAFDDSLVPACAMTGPRNIKLYRYDVGPFPSGLFVDAVGDAGSITPVLWAFAGCKKQAVQCGKPDPDLFVTPAPPNASLLTLPVAPPGSVFFIAVGDNNAASGAFHLVASPTRLFSDFEGSAEGWSLGQGWVLAGTNHSVTANNPAADAALSSPDIDVIGITDLAVTIVSSLNAGATANVIAVPDGGSPLASVLVPDTAGMPGIKVVHVPLPAGTKSAKLTLTLVHATTNPVWDIHRVIVGPG